MFCKFKSVVVFFKILTCLLTSRITQVIIEIPKQKNVTILPKFAIVDKSSYTLLASMCHAIPFELALWKKKTFSLTFIPGKNKSKCGFMVCTLIDNGYASLLFFKQCFLIASAC